jgi:hypothetical protein
MESPLVAEEGVYQSECFETDRCSYSTLLLVVRDPQDSRNEPKPIISLYAQYVHTPY